MIEETVLDSIPPKVLMGRLDEILRGFIKKLHDKYGNQIPKVYVVSPAETIQFVNIQVSRAGNGELDVCYGIRIINHPNPDGDISSVVVALQKENPNAEFYISDKGLF